MKAYGIWRETETGGIWVTYRGVGVARGPIMCFPSRGAAVAEFQNVLRDTSPEAQKEFSVREFGEDGLPVK